MAKGFLLFSPYMKKHTIAGFEGFFKLTPLKD